MILLMVFFGKGYVNKFFKKFRFYWYNNVNFIGKIFKNNLIFNVLI